MRTNYFAVIEGGKGVASDDYEQYTELLFVQDIRRSFALTPTGKTVSLSTTQRKLLQKIDLVELDCVGENMLSDSVGKKSAAVVPLDDAVANSCGLAGLLLVDTEVCPDEHPYFKADDVVGSIKTDAKLQELQSWCANYNLNRLEETIDISAEEANAVDVFERQWQLSRSF